jgi:hypothetical protein
MRAVLREDARYLTLVEVKLAKCQLFDNAFVIPRMAS